MIQQLLRSFKIKKRIALVLIIGIIFFSFSLLGISKMLSQLIIEKYYYNHLKSLHEEIQNGIYLFITNINLTCVNLLQNQTIYDLITDNSLSFDTKENQLRNLLDRIGINNKYISDIVIFTKDNDIYNYNPNLIPQAFISKDYLKTIDNKVNPVAWGPIVKQTENNLLLLGKRYYNFFTGQYLGRLIIFVNEKSISEICNRNFQNDSILSFLIGENYQIISHPDKNIVGGVILDRSILKTEDDFNCSVKLLNGKPFLIAISKPNDQLQRLKCNWYTVSLLPLSNLKKQLQQINYVIIWFSLIIILLSIITSINISEKLTQPIQSLLVKINSFAINKNLKPYKHKKYNDEIGELELAFEDMTKRISNLVETINKDMEKQRELELTALSVQINPHFLYNTLDAISWIAKIKKQPEIEKIVIALAKFYRISLHKGEKNIRLQEELELVKNFVTIEKIRFPNKFEIEYNIHPDTLECKIPKFTLQPIVENSIKHGIIPKKSKGLITINSEIIENQLIIEVIDDGIGFNVKELEKSKTKSKSGYGLKNVDQRLKLEFGANYGLIIESSPNKGTIVTIKMLAKKD